MKFFRLMGNALRPHCAINRTGFSFFIMTNLAYISDKYIFASCGKRSISLWAQWFPITALLDYSEKIFWSGKLPEALSI
jgi:hypothetical protein